MLKICVVRSVSFQDVGVAVKFAKEKLGAGEVILLSHEHSGKRAKMVPGVDAVLFYRHRGRFTPARPACGVGADLWVVPIEGRRVLPYLNVVMFAVASGARRVIILRVGGKGHLCVGKTAIAFLALAWILVRLAAFPFAVVAGALAGFLALLRQQREIGGWSNVQDSADRTRVNRRER